MVREQPDVPEFVHNPGIYLLKAKRFLLISFFKQRSATFLSKLTN